MYRYFLFFLLILPACTGTDRFAEAAFQNKVDSVVNARLDSVQNSLQHRNDSLILEAAHRRADSLRMIRLKGTLMPQLLPAGGARPVQP